MGLDVTHDCWHGAYSAFARFREVVAAAAGFEMHEREPGDYTPRYWQPEWDGWATDAMLGGEWDQPPEDPLLVLLVHSDCDGVIPVKVAPFLAERLERLAPSVPETGAGHMPDARAAVLRFAAGLRSAAEAGDDVEFW